MHRLSAAFAPEQPYSGRFLELRRLCTALIERMEIERQQGAAQAPSATWAIGHPGLILARSDWDGARLILRWGIDDPPRVASGAPSHELDLVQLKLAAQAASHPQVWFEHYLVYVLQSVQDELIEFFRDGPTDDIPFYRHQVCMALGDAGATFVWVGEVVFDWPG